MVVMMMMVMMVKVRKQKEQPKKRVGQARSQDLSNRKRSTQGAFFSKFRGDFSFLRTFCLQRLLAGANERASR